EDGGRPVVSGGEPEARAVTLYRRERALLRIGGAAGHDDFQQPEAAVDQGRQPPPVLDGRHVSSRPTYGAPRPEGERDVFRTGGYHTASGSASPGIRNGIRNHAARSITVAPPAVKKPSFPLRGGRPDSTL